MLSFREQVCCLNHVGTVIYLILFLVCFSLFFFFFFCFVLFFIFFYILYLKQKKEEKRGGGYVLFIVGFCQVHEDFCEFFFFLRRKTFVS